MDEKYHLWMCAILFGILGNVLATFIWGLEAPNSQLSDGQKELGIIAVIGLIAAVMVVTFFKPSNRENSKQQKSA